MVATVKSLEGYPIEDYAYRLGRAWKIGSAKNDDGVLLLVAPNERKVWIATGYGAGGFLTDAMSGIIIREAILPHFKQKPARLWRRDRGRRRRDHQADEPAARRSAKECRRSRRKRSSSASIRAAVPLPVIFWVMIIGFVVLSHVPARRRAPISPAAVAASARGSCCGA